MAATGVMALGAQSATAASKANVCVIIKGVVHVENKGTATCTVTATNSTAIAVGDGSEATALGPGTQNKAKAIGDGSQAHANVGSNNTATAIGGCDATAIGSNQTDVCKPGSG